MLCFELLLKETYHSLMTETNILLAEQLKKARKEKRINQREFAEILEISTRAFSFYETGKAFPPLSTLIKIADFFDLTLDELITGDSQRAVFRDKKLYNFSRAVDKLNEVDRLTAKKMLEAILVKNKLDPKLEEFRNHRSFKDIFI